MNLYFTNKKRRRRRNLFVVQCQRWTSLLALNRIYTTYYWLLKTMLNRKQKSNMNTKLYNSERPPKIIEQRDSSILSMADENTQRHAHTQRRNFSFFFWRRWNESLWPLPPPPLLLMLMLLPLLSLQPPTKWNSKLFFNKFFLFRWPHRLFSHNAIKNAIVSKLNHQFIMIYRVLLYFLVCIAWGIKFHYCYDFVWVKGHLPNCVRNCFIAFWNDKLFSRS